jgi:hypothetical protein
MLGCRSVNTSELLSVLPRQTKDAESKYRYINRWLKNPLIKPVEVMGGFIPEIAALAGADGKTIVLMTDQTKISDGFECLMISLRVGERAIPVVWTVKETRGSIGFDVQEPLLDAAFAMTPDGASVLLAADRFYGGAALVAWRKKRGWKWRIRLKGNLILRHPRLRGDRPGGEITTGEAAKAGMAALHDAEFNETGVSARANA